MIGTLQEYQYTFLIISRSVLLRMANVSDKICRVIETHNFCSIMFFDKRAACEIVLKNIVQPVRPQIIWRILKSKKHTHNK